MPGEYEHLSGWLPTPDKEWAAMEWRFQAWKGIAGTVPTRNVSWDLFEQIKYDPWRRYQEIGDCVSWGAAKAAMSTELAEIIRGGQAEEFHPLFEPWIYGTCRNDSDAGRGRLRGSDGAMGAWVAISAAHSGVLRSDFPGCPKYSGEVARQWGNGQGYDQFRPEAQQRVFKRIAQITTGDELVEALMNDYFVSIAGYRQFPRNLTIHDGKGWYEGGQRYGHQTSIQGIDVTPTICVYDSNQWPGHATDQPDGPPGGGWRTLDYVDRELRSGDVECFAFSTFEGFPAIEQKPNFSVGD